MSHISKIELEVTDLYALEQACSRLGLQWVKGQKTFTWFGSEDGECDHVIKVPNAGYEIGVVQNAGVYELHCDFYDRGIGAVIGEKAGLLKQAYATCKTRIEARRKGYSVLEQKIDQGIRVRVRIP